MLEHINGTFTRCYTYRRRPVELAFSQDFDSRDEALSSELQIKGWSRKKKEAMMRDDWEEVSRLAHTVRAEPVEAHNETEGEADHPSTGSGRTERCK